MVRHVTSVGNEITSFRFQQWITGFGEIVWHVWKIKGAMSSSSEAALCRVQLGANTWPTWWGLLKWWTGKMHMSTITGNSHGTSQHLRYQYFTIKHNEDQLILSANCFYKISTSISNISYCLRCDIENLKYHNIWSDKIRHDAFTTRLEITQILSRTDICRYINMMSEILVSAIWILCSNVQY